MLLKKGSKGTAVTELQHALGMRVKTYGFYGDLTVSAVKKYQKLKGLKDDGEAGDLTLASLGLTNLEETLSTDITNSSVKIKGDVAENHDLLKKGEYVEANEEKWYDVWHHTAGAHNPYAVKKQWETDTRGRIATQHILGGIGLNGETKHDGVLVRCMPEGSWASHLGANGNKNLHPKSVAVEVCNYGYLTKGGYFKNKVWVTKDPARFYTYTGNLVPEEQVCDLGFKFRGYQFYHKYTDNQLRGLYSLAKYNAGKNPKIDYTQGILKWVAEATTQAEILKAFEFNQDAYSGKVKGLMTHTNIRKDKSDMSPQPNLIAMMKELYNEFSTK